MVGKQVRGRRHRQGRRQDGAPRSPPPRCPKITVHHRRLVRRRQLRHVRPRLRAALPVHVAQRAHLGDGRRAGRRRAGHGQARAASRRDGEAMAAEERGRASRRRSATSTRSRATRTTPRRACGTTASSIPPRRATCSACASRPSLNAPIERDHASACSGCESVTRMFNQVLIANRGEIACRVIAHRASAWASAPSRSIRDADARRRCTSRWRTRRSASARRPARESYLASSASSTAAHAPGAEAIHPGYGFLSENADFAEALRRGRAGLHRPAAGRDPRHGQQDRAPRRSWSGRRAGGAGLSRRRPGCRDACAGEADAHRLSRC